MINWYFIYWSKMANSIPMNEMKYNEKTEPVAATNVSQTRRRYR